MPVRGVVPRQAPDQLRSCPTQDALAGRRMSPSADGTDRRSHLNKSPFNMKLTTEGAQMAGVHVSMKSKTINQGGCPAKFRPAGELANRRFAVSRRMGDGQPGSPWKRARTDIG
jgi:hypothetical protein